MDGKQWADIIDAVQKLERKLVDRVAAIVPQHWVGNETRTMSPKEHFDAGSIECSTGIDGTSGRVWIAHKFELGGVPHVVRASVMYDEFGVRGGDDIITLDAVDVGDADFVIGHRAGIWGLRVVCNYRGVIDGVAVDYRFDGDVIG